jgi:S1-C subfamily serine protease
MERPGTARPGFVIAPLDDRLVVALVEPAGPAAVAGLQVGDAIVEIDDHNVTRLWPSAIMYLVWTHPKGTMRLVVDRDGARRDLSIPIHE